MFFKNIRFYILLFSFLITIGLLVWGITTINEPFALATKLDQLYGLGAILFLYLTFLVGSITKIFLNIKFKELLVKSQLALGISALIFVTPHVYFAFFQELGGFIGLTFLNDKYLLGVGLGFTSLVILCLFSLTYFRFLNKYREIIQKILYMAGFLTIIHALLFGSQFITISDLIPQIFFACLIILLILEAARFDNYLKSKFSTPSFGISLALVLILSTVGTTFIYLPNQSGRLPSFNIHAAHIQLAQQAQQGGPGLNTTLLNSNIPGLSGDPTRRFSVGFSHPENIKANEDTSIKFQTYDASNGNQIDFFLNIYEKPMHLVIVDNELKYYAHIHPTQVGNQFMITTQFPHDGTYHLYINFQPLGAIEQQFAFTLNVGDTNQKAVSTISPDTNFTNIFDKYQVTLKIPNSLKASNLSVGKQTLTFAINDAKSGQPITTLKPYLAAFGHLVMINENTYDYLHVHPSNIVPPLPSSNGGPNVDFIPLGLYGPIKPGIYRVFGQFNPDNRLFVADFTVKIE